MSVNPAHYEAGSLVHLENYADALCNFGMGLGCDAHIRPNSGAAVAAELCSENLPDMTNRCGIILTLDLSVGSSQIAKTAEMTRTL
jgi:hypothetical protein